jgi:hypothetical protein
MSYGSPLRLHMEQGRCMVLDRSKPEARPTFPREIDP